VQKNKKKRLRERLHATFAKKCKPEGMHASMQTLAKENVRKNKGKRKTTSAKKTKKDYKNDCMQRLPKKT
jgi:multimeric flavodoxin WrbA